MQHVQRTRSEFHPLSRFLLKKNVKIVGATFLRGEVFLRFLPVDISRIMIVFVMACLQDRFKRVPNILIWRIGSYYGLIYCLISDVLPRL